LTGRQSGTPDFSPGILFNALNLAGAAAGTFLPIRLYAGGWLPWDMLLRIQNPGWLLLCVVIGVGLRVVIFGFEANPRYPEADPVPFTVLINPVLTPIGEVQDEDWEGCLSVPGMRGLVPRYRELRYRGFDAAGNPIDRSVRDFHARVVQHEVDHLDGILYPRRILDLTQFGFNEALFPGEALQDD